MILVDSSIWVDHFRAADPSLTALLNANEVLCHPFVTGEVLMGNARNWTELRRMLERLPQVLVARDVEVLDLVARYRFFGTGIGYVDAHMLASAQIAGDAKLWTRDRRLEQAARLLNLTTVSLPGLQ